MSPADLAALGSKRLENVEALRERDAEKPSEWTPWIGASTGRFTVEDEIALWQRWAGDDLEPETVRRIVEDAYGVHATSGPIRL